MRETLSATRVPAVLSVPLCFIRLLGPSILAFVGTGAVLIAINHLSGGRLVQMGGEGSLSDLAATVAVNLFTCFVAGTIAGPLIEWRRPE
jgi:hypothetical protein